MAKLHSTLDFRSSTEVDLEALSLDLAICLQVWEDMKVEGRMPSWHDVSLLDFPTRVIPLIAVIDVDWDRPGPVDGDAMEYRFWGTGHVYAKNIERTGMKLTEMSDRADVVVGEYLRVINEKKPVAFRKYIRINKPTQACLQTTVRLPLSNDGNRVDGVLSASEWEPLGAQN